MEPVTLGLGLGLSAIGTIGGIGSAQEQAGISKQIAADELKFEAQRQKAMELQNRRMMLQQIRQQQVAQAMALTTATSQGASQGSALGGAYGQIAGQTGTNVTGLSQNLLIGRNMFNINSEISGLKMKMA